MPALWIEPKGPQERVLVSKPGAAIQMWEVPWPQGTKEAIAHAFECKVR